MSSPWPGTKVSQGVSRLTRHIYTLSIAVTPEYDIYTGDWNGKLERETPSLCLHWLNGAGLAGKRYERIPAHSHGQAPPRTKGSAGLAGFKQTLQILVTNPSKKQSPLVFSCENRLRRTLENLRKGKWAIVSFGRPCRLIQMSLFSTVINAWATWGM